MIGFQVTREQIELLTAAMYKDMARYTVIINGLPCLNLDEIIFEGMMN